MADLIPIGAIVTVTPFSGEPYRAKVLGYDTGQTKYRVGRQNSSGTFSAATSDWAFLGQVRLAGPRGLTVHIPFSVIYDERSLTAAQAERDLFRMLEEVEQHGFMDRLGVELTYGDPVVRIPFDPVPSTEEDEDEDEDPPHQVGGA